MHIFALAVPVDQAEPAFAGKLGEPRPRCEVPVGHMGKREHCQVIYARSYELPMMMPAANTKTPPTTT